MQVVLALAMTGAPLLACGGGDSSSSSSPSGDAPDAGASPTGTGTPPPPPAADAGVPLPGAARWNARLGGIQTDVGYTVAGDSAGNVVVAGSFQGTADLAGVILTSAGGSDIFVAKYAPDGTALWARRIGGKGNEMATSVAIGSTGDILVGGASDGSIDYDGTVLGGGGAAGTLLLQLDKFGNVAMARAYGGDSYGTIVGVAVAADGSVALCGAYQGTIDLGAGPLPAAQGTYDAFLARFDPTAMKLVYAKHLGGDGVDLAQGVAFGPKGVLAVIGSFSGTGDFGSGARTAVGKSDVFAGAFDKLGTLAWNRYYGGLDTDDGRSIAFDPAGDIFLAGGFGSTVDFGHGPVNSQGLIDGFVLKLTPTSAPDWAQTFGSPGDDEAVSIAADASGDALVGGLFEQNMMIGGTAFVSAGDRDVVALKLGGDGSHLWTRHFGSVEADVGVGVAFDGPGHALVTGFFRKQVDFGTGLKGSAGDDDVFVATFQP
jgi:hypothetical protein